VTSGYLERMFRSLTGRPETGAGVPPALNAVRILVVLTVVVSVPLVGPRPGSAAGAVVIALLVVIAASAVSWLLARGDQRRVTWSLAVLGGAGGVLAGLVPLSPAVAVGCVATSAAAITLVTEVSLGITAETVAAFLIAGLVGGAPVAVVVGYPLTYIGLWAFGLTRHAYLQRATEAERTLAEARRAHAAETQAAALAERARIAREIHDVLAHSLATVSVNLEAAEGLLGTLPEGPPELAKAIECIERAGSYTRSGLADARRAILALRDDAGPLPEQLAELVGRSGVPVDFEVMGEPRPIPGEVALAAYRTVQEALTNARKHAPGQPVGCKLAFEESGIVVAITNPLPPEGGRGPLAATGAGYGLTGLRERAALAGGTLTAGPSDGKWRVCLTIPA